MTSEQSNGVLLALDAGVRETGWAVFGPGEATTTGVIGTAHHRRMDAQSRVSQLIESLDLLVERRQPGEAAHSLPSGIRWEVPALDLLSTGLIAWSRRHKLPLYAYTSQEVRSAIAGHTNASQDQLAYAVMLRLGLIGQGKTTHEWEALAVGHYHLYQRPGAGTRAASG